ncbi:PTS fructose transporter subunit IIB [Salinivibrio sp. ES.052]|uniref:PTS fructose transporter subunit IIB n=1 Tax=Salinivibrio sp. ES.052 TaxID=1882823 RepID=UPI0020C9614A|nr:PTS fructose transporter subunit IIB [Salinivibrio sp. ES.052]
MPSTMNNIVAITACPTGIAHTYMAAEQLEKAAKSLSIQIKVETQGAMGIENALSLDEIMQAACVVIVSDIELEKAERFSNSTIVRLAMEDVLTDAKTALQKQLPR